MRTRYIASFFALLALVHATSQAQNINKCVLNGKTVYSDQTCPGNAVKKPVELHHAAGIVSPDRDTVTDTINRIQDENWVNAVPGRSKTRTTTRQGNTTTHSFDNPLPAQATAPINNKKSVCDAISARIDQLDSMARQPQSGSGQDWIKQEKTRERTEQFRLSC